MRAKTMFLTSGQKGARLPVIEWVPGHLQPPTRPGDGSQAPARFLLPADQTGAAAAAGGQAGQPACRPREAARAAAAVAAAEGEAAPAAAEAEAAAAAALLLLLPPLTARRCAGGHLFKLSPTPLGHPHPEGPG